MRNYIGVIVIIILSVIVFKDGCTRIEMMKTPNRSGMESESTANKDDVPLEQNIIHLKNINEPALPSLEPFREQPNPFKPKSRQELKDEPPSLD